jgi:hypothetical protein
MSKLILIAVIVYLLMPLNSYSEDQPVSVNMLNIGLNYGCQYKDMGSDSKTFCNYGLNAGWKHGRYEVSASYDYSAGSDREFDNPETESVQNINLNLLFYPLDERVFNIYGGIYTGVLLSKKETFTYWLAENKHYEADNKAIFQAGVDLGLFVRLPWTRGSGLFLNFRMPVINYGYWTTQMGFRFGFPV